MEETSREILEAIEDDLIELIQRTTSEAALELLTGALMRVRSCSRYIDHFEA